MRKYIIRLKGVLEVDEIKCNKCGSVLDINCLGVNEFEIEQGFGSKDDGYIHKFDLCDKCYNNIIKRFKIRVTKSGT